MYTTILLPDTPATTLPLRAAGTCTALLEPAVLQSALSVAFANFVAFEQSRALVEKGSPLECEPRWVHATQREPLGVARTQIVGAPWAP